MIINLTAGTVGYIIPLPKPYRLKRAYPLIISESNSGVTIECPAFGEYGTDKDYNGAMADLGSSIVDYWKSLRKLKNPGEDEARVLKEMDEQIEKVSV